jgi:hypothetical protein
MSVLTLPRFCEVRGVLLTGTHLKALLDEPFNPKRNL